MKKIIFLILISVGFKVSAGQFWIDPRSSVFSETIVGPHIPAETFKIRDLNPGFRNGMVIKFGDAAPTRPRAFQLIFFNSLGQKICTNGQLATAPNDCIYTAIRYEHVSITLSNDFDSVMIGTDCYQNCMSQVDENSLVAVYTTTSLVNNGQIKKICPNGQEISGPFFAGDHVVVSAQIEPGLTCEGSEFWMNNGAIKISPTTSSADAGGLVKFDISSLSANASGMNAYIFGRNSVGQIKEIGSVGINFPGFVNPIVYTTDIYQVIKNPILFTPSNIVDLVAGKNADIILETNLVQADITGTVLEWKNKSGVVEKVFPVKSNQTDATGKIIFEIDPVPKESEYVGGETQFSIKLMLNNGCGSTSLAQTITKTVHIRKTKPIRIGFVPINGCIDDKPGQASCFSAPSSSDVTNMAKHGGDIMKATYPVAEDEYFADYFETEFMVPRYYTEGSSEFDSDINELEKRRSLYTPKYVDFLVGVVSEDYRKKRKVLDENGNEGSVFDNRIVGSILSTDQIGEVAARDGKLQFRTLFVDSLHYVTLAHEVGHYLSLLHTCENIPLDEYCQQEQKTLDGYNSSNLPSNWNLGRMLVGDRSSLMRFGTERPLFTNPLKDPQRPWEKDKWISKQEYLTLFRVRLNNIIRNKNFDSLAVDQKILKIYGYVNSNNFVLSSLYFKPLNTEFFPNLQQGNFQIDVLDSSKNIIYTNYTDQKTSTEGKSQHLSFELPIDQNVMFIKIYKIIGQNKTLYREISLPTEILNEELKYIDPKSVKSTISQLKNSLNLEIKKLDRKIKCQSYSAAKVHLSTSILSMINQQMKELSLTNSLNTDAKKMKNAAMESLVRISQSTQSAGNYYNSFIDACVERVDESIFKKSKITVDLVKQPENKEYLYIVDVQLDNMDMILTNLGSSYVVQSISLSQGLHQWKVSTYMVNRKIYQGLQSSINGLKKTIDALKLQLPDVEIAKKIVIQERNLDGLKQQLLNEKKSQGNPQYFNFEVL